MINSLFGYRVLLASACIADAARRGTDPSERIIEKTLKPATPKATW
jgi:hypothetical protein